jgi:hypothetical protein
MEERVRRRSDNGPNCRRSFLPMIGGAALAGGRLCTQLVMNLVIVGIVAVIREK